MNSYLILDIENNNSNRYHRKAGNFLYDSIVAIALKTSEELTSKYIFPNKLKDLDFFDCSQDSGQDHIVYTYDPINRMLHITKERLRFDVLVGHNIKHDLLFLWNLPGIQEFLKRGGKIWDTSIAEYILSDLQTKYPALRETAVKYDCQERVKNIDDLLFNKEVRMSDIRAGLGEQNFRLATSIKDIEEYDRLALYKQVSDLPKELVLIDVENDVLDTEQVYLRQREEAEKRGLTTLIEIQNDFLLSTIEMEANGFKVDKDVLLKNKTELEAILEQKKLELNKLVTIYWNNSVMFNLNSDDCMSVILYGGTLNVEEKLPILNSKGEFEIYKTGDRSGQIRFRITRTQVNIRGFGFTPQEDWKCKKKGFWKTNEKILNAITHKNIHQEVNNQQEIDINLFINLVLQIRGLEKQITTYYDGVLERIYDIDGCVHPEFNHTATDTMRLSCKNPNLQNQPKSNESKVTEHFITRY